MIVYDIEIKKAVPQKGEEPTPGIEYCKGWGDKANMGISVITVYDFIERRFRIFMDDNKDEFAELVANRRWVIGFNSKNFDDPVIEACWGIHVPAEKQFDLKEVVIDAVQKRDGGNRFKRGYKLDQICSANLGSSKSGDGAMAPVLWQQGKIGELIDYCLQDTNVTTDLFNLIMSSSSIVDPVNSGDRIRVERPDTLFQAWEILMLEPNLDKALEKYKAFVLAN